MLLLVDAASHCVLYDYATGKMVTVLFSEDENQGMFYPSIMIDIITPEATAPSNYTSGAQTLLLVLAHHNGCSSIHLGTCQH